MKLKLEQAQRERRHNAEQEGKTEKDYHTPMWFKKSEKVFIEHSYYDIVRKPLIKD